jgi:hypothetical protein
VTPWWRPIISSSSLTITSYYNTSFYNITSYYHLLLSPLTITSYNHHHLLLSSLTITSYYNTSFYNIISYYHLLLYHLLLSTPACIPQPFIQEPIFSPLTILICFLQVVLRRRRRNSARITFGLCSSFVRRRRSHSTYWTCCSRCAFVRMLHPPCTTFRAHFWCVHFYLWDHFTYFVTSLLTSSLTSLHLSLHFTSPLTSLHLSLHFFVGIIIFRLCSIAKKETFAWPMTCICEEPSGTRPGPSALQWSESTSDPVPYLQCNTIWWIFIWSMCEVLMITIHCCLCWCVLMFFLWTLLCGWW